MKTPEKKGPENVGAKKHPHGGRAEDAVPLWKGERVVRSDRPKSAKAL